MYSLYIAYHTNCLHAFSYSLKIYSYSSDSLKDDKTSQSFYSLTASENEVGSSYFKVFSYLNTSG